MRLATYLHTHFVEKAAFAAQAGITVARLDALIDARAIPRATYTCDGASIRSAVFGEIPIDEPLTGAYFRPECVRWAVMADRAPPGAERTAVLAGLEDELRTALRIHCDDRAAIDARIQGYLPFFFDGTFGLCVADPSSGAGIVRKEMLQEHLVEVTANGSDPSAHHYPRDALLKLIDDYADAAMPFSPAEYQRSSRKRLVDDLRPIVAGEGR